ncbi:MAG: hypothetical protein KF853_05125 [Rhodocyclaceae bacterium]|nr:hypothetical protein [Rhodocyclaceae bacterium]
MDENTRKTLSGITFPADADGRHSSLAAGREMFAAALAAVSPQAAEAARAERNWRGGYMPHVRRAVELGLADPASASAIAQAGLAALHANFEYLHGGEALPLQAAMARPGGIAFETVTIAGRGEQKPELAVPYRGERLAGDALRRQLAAWATAGVVEPSFAAAVGEVIARPDWLDLSDWHVAVMGAGAELGPLPTLVNWRANLAVIDLPGTPAWGRIIATARAGNGRVLLPMHEPLSPDDPTLAFKAGADLLHETVEIRDWLAALPGPLVVGSYAYLDGEAHVRVSLAMDAIVASLLEWRPDAVPAWLLSPTDVFAVPAEDAEASMEAWRSRGAIRLLQTPLRLLSGNRYFVPNIERLVDCGGVQAGIVDALVAQQGANYALAKRLQAWRAAAAHMAGRRVSANVAPATRTRSVVKNKALAAAYGGANHFGVEVFEPDTANALMAALLVYDLRQGGSTPAHPARLFMDNAVHGGLWRIPYLPRSALPFAAVLGLF